MTGTEQYQITFEQAWAEHKVTIRGILKLFDYVDCLTDAGATIITIEII